MSVEEVEDEDNIRPQKAIPKKGSHILERADGSDDDNAPKKITKACLFTFYFKKKLTVCIRK